jgi:hypothetical protein
MSFPCFEGKFPIFSFRAFTSSFTAQKLEQLPTNNHLLDKTKQQHRTALSIFNRTAPKPIQQNEQ